MSPTPGRSPRPRSDCGDVTLLVNNAGILHGSAFLDAGAADSARAEMEVNYFGTLAMCRAFAPVLGRGPAAARW